MLQGFLPDDEKKLKFFIKVIEVAIFSLWVCSLLVGLASLRGNRAQNTSKDYLVAFGTFITFVCYCGLIALRTKNEEISDKWKEDLDKWKENVNTRLSNLEANLELNSADNTVEV